MDDLAPGIEQYLLSTCLFVIDDFNEKYADCKDKAELKLEAMERFTEADLVVRIGYPFRQMARFVMQSSKGKNEDGNDIIVDSKGFRVEVKYLKPQLTDSGTSSGKGNWGPIQEDFEWLMGEIDNGQKHKRAFVIGWFNCTDRFSELMQLGSMEIKGRLRKIDTYKERFFSHFINYDPISRYTNTITYKYINAYDPCSLSIPGFNGQLHSLFLGRKSDKFHIAIYF